MAGLAGQLTKGMELQPGMAAFVGMAFAGGSLGAWFGARRFNQHILKYLLAVVLLMASIKLLLT